MFIPLKTIFERVVKSGDLDVVDYTGKRYHFGDGTGRKVAVRFRRASTELRLVFNPQLALGEAYINQDLVVEVGTIYDFLDVVLRNTLQRPLPGWTGAFDGIRRLSKYVQQYNPVSRARANVAHHYDIDGAIYDLFLDQDRQYSCAYFQGTEDLDRAQTAKKRHIAAKLALGSGQRVLDIGSGWGGLALYLARVANVDVTGITVSAEQLRVARKRSEAAGLANQVRFESLDYRHVQGQFDRVVSVGMFEHVGVNHYRTYFERLGSLLTDDGVALVHAIGRFDRPAVTNSFIAKYIFPGGYIPALSEVMPAIERSGLVVTDIEILRLHYAETLRHWRLRFMAERQAASDRLGDRFCRMWEFYLAGSEAAFRYQGLMVFQIQLARHQGALPLTRTYIFEDEQRLAAIEQAERDAMNATPSKAA
jgi:cyclopropane-fatty-acyl-phospholipid synthase